MGDYQAQNARIETGIEEAGASHANAAKDAISAPDGLAAAEQTWCAANTKRASIWTLPIAPCHHCADRNYCG